MKKWVPVLILISLWAVICYRTYVVKTYLIGWDNLVPELGFEINISRALSTAWQEYQGLGLLGGMGHAADLTRQIILWVISLVVPTSMIRWAWTLAMLLVGSLGIYTLGVLLFRSTFCALVGGLFYLLNPVTMQVFNVPFETFTSFYGFIPWMIWGALGYLRNGKRSSLVKLLVILLIGMSAFVVQTLFVVFAVALTMFSVEYFIKYKDVKRVLKLWGIVLIVNLFWLLPVIWFGITSSSVNINAKMNVLATHEVELMNMAYGKIDDVARLNGWWLQNTDVDKNGGMILLMESWTEWLSNSYVKMSGITIFLLAVVGLFSILRKDYFENLKWSWILLGLFILAMLARGEAIFSRFYDLISQGVPLFGQMFRAGYTKWSMPMILIMSVGIMSLTSLFNKRYKVMSWVTGMVILSLTTYTTLPLFRDGIIGERMKVDLPSGYLNLFEYFKTTQMGRVITLPANSVWGWQYHDWGYRGSGFLWYGIEQPILDRAFDVWSPYNETFYNQFSTALYGGEKEDIGRVIKQYDVKYVILDESVISPGQGREILRIEETRRMADELGWDIKFHEGFLTVWDTGLSNNSFVSAPSSYSLADGDIIKTRKDEIYKDLGTYVSSNRDLVARYPFADLMKEETKRVDYIENGVQLTIGGLQPGQKLVVPGWKVGDIVRIDFKDGKPLPAYIINGVTGPMFLGKEKPENDQSYFVAKVSEDKEWSEYLGERRFDLRSDTLKVEVESIPDIYDFSTQGNVDIKNCDVLGRGTASKQGNSYIADERGSVCDYVAMKELDTRLSYLMRVKGENKEGRSIKFFLYNTTSNRNDLEYLLNKDRFDQTFNLLPWVWDGFYTLNIDVRSFGQVAENRIDSVAVHHIPIDKIARAKILNEKSPLTPIENKLEVKGVKKIGTWLYIVETKNAGLLRLSQGYDEGWVSPWIEHVKVDGWANGWMVPGSVTIAIFYWPQLLEYLGFGLLGITIIWLIYKRK